MTHNIYSAVIPDREVSPLYRLSEAAVVILVFAREKPAGSA